MLFNWMNNIENADLKKLISDIDKKRSCMLKYDKNLLLSDPQNYDLDNLNQIPNDGRVDIKTQNVVFETFFHYKSSKKLYVILNGARTQEPPEFKRWSWYPFMDGSVLNIADPMYRRFPEVNIGWYYGDNSVSYRHLVAEIVQKLAKLLDVESKGIVFYGSSGGGAAVIHCASLIPGSVCVSINPQIVLQEFQYHKTFQNKTKIDLSKKDKFHRNNLLYFLENSKESNYILIQNLRSPEDMQQVGNIVKKLDILPHYGLTQLNNLWLWLYDSPSLVPHNAQEYYCIYFVIDYLIDALQNSKKVDIEFLNYINEIWYERSNLKLTLDQSKRYVRILGNKSKVVFSKENDVIEDSVNKWDYKLLSDNLLPESTYRFSCFSTESIFGNAEQIVVGLRDNLTDTFVSKKYKVGEKIDFTFVTAEVTSKIQLRIYAGIPGETKGNSVRLISPKLEII